MCRQQIGITVQSSEKAVAETSGGKKGKTKMSGTVDRMGDFLVGVI